MTGCTSGGYDQFETSPEAIEQELRPADRLMANYGIDILIFNYVIFIVFFVLAIAGTSLKCSEIMLIWLRLSEMDLTMT